MKIIEVHKKIDKKHIKSYCNSFNVLPLMCYTHFIQTKYSTSMADFKLNLSLGVFLHPKIELSNKRFSI